MMMMTMMMMMLSPLQPPQIGIFCSSVLRELLVNLSVMATDGGLTLIGRMG
jgi:hypothetical protein